MNPENFDQPTFAEILQGLEAEVARLTAELDERRNVSRRNGEQGKATDEEWLRLTSAHSDLRRELAAAREDAERLTKLAYDWKRKAEYLDKDRARLVLMNESLGDALDAARRSGEGEA